MFQTILANENELDINPQEIDPLDHPQYFIKMRYQGLNNVQTKIQYERTVLDDKGGYLGVLVREYEKAARYQRLKKMEEELPLKSDQYKSVFDTEKPQEEIEKEAYDKMREDYFQKFVLEHGAEMAAQREAEERKKNYVINLKGKALERMEKFDPEEELERLKMEKMGQLYRQYEKYETQMAKILATTDQLVEKGKGLYTCKNDKLVDALSGYIKNSFEVYSEEICENLIDDLLLEQVIFLDQLECFSEDVEEYKVGKVEQNKIIPEDVNTKPIPENVYRLIKALDDLADDD